MKCSKVDVRNAQFKDSPDRGIVGSVAGGSNAAGAGPGWIEGYAAVFDNVDAQGEVIRRGAFSKTISERVPAGRVKLMTTHVATGGSTMQVIGTVTRAREDSRGLWIHADLSSDATAQEARTKVAEGHVLGLSIGYVPLSRGETIVAGRKVIELREVKLLEVTLTPFPANELAEVTSAKESRTGFRLQRASANRAGSPPSPRSVGEVTGDWKSEISRRRLALAKFFLIGA